MTLIDDIRKDREAGTPGPWDGRYVEDGMPTDVCKFGVISTSAGHETARVWGLEDAYRIARVPDMEAALLAAEELAEAVVAWREQYIAAGAMPLDEDVIEDMLCSSLAAYREATGG